MATSSRKSNSPVMPLTSAFNRSSSPYGRIGSYSSAFAADVNSSPFASSTSSSFYSSPVSSQVYSRSSSPTRVNLHGLAPVTSSSVKFSLASRSGSPNRSMAVSSREQVVRKQNAGNPLKNVPKKTCMCSPTTHPGSFRCSLHKRFNNNNNQTVTYSPNRLNARRSAMTNSLVRIGTVEGGDLVKRALAALIRPSSHQQRRRTAFEPRPSRLSVMSKADDL
ncbi:hypothetical protein Hanom_Chr13g01237861 [Helianthus anomalus]